MRRSLLLLIFASALTLHAEMSDEEKRRLFLNAREDIRPVPRATQEATPRPKPKPAPTQKTTPKPSATPKPTPREQPEETPTPKASPTPAPTARPTAEPKVESTPKSTQKPGSTAKPSPKPTESAPTPIPEASAKPVATTKPTPAPTSQPTPKPTPPQIPKGKTPGGEKLDAPILIEKSGLQGEEGLEPPKKKSGGIFKRWRYLTPAIRKAIDQAPVKKGRWKYIIVHNSGTRQGNARAFDNYHRNVRKMQNGLAYHFVIGNGSSSGNGEVEIGNRWTRQINGGHVASDYLNNIALGICLVGDLNRDAPSQAQLEALDELITYLRGRVGKVKGKPAIVLPHKKINPKPTDCPGDRFNYKWLSRKFGS